MISRITQEEAQKIIRDRYGDRAICCGADVTPGLPIILFWRYDWENDETQIKMYEII